MVPIAVMPAAILERLAAHALRRSGNQKNAMPSRPLPMSRKKC